MNPYEMGYTLFHRLWGNGSFKHGVYTKHIYHKPYACSF